MVRVPGGAPSPGNELRLALNGAPRPEEPRRDEAAGQAPVPPAHAVHVGHLQREIVDVGAEAPGELDLSVAEHVRERHTEAAANQAAKAGARAAPKTAARSTRSEDGRHNRGDARRRRREARSARPTAVPQRARPLARGTVQPCPRPDPATALDLELNVVAAAAIHAEGERARSAATASAGLVDVIPLIPPATSVTRRSARRRGQPVHVADTVAIADEEQRVAIRGPLRADLLAATTSSAPRITPVRDRAGRSEARRTQVFENACEAIRAERDRRPSGDQAGWRSANASAVS